MTDPPHGKPSPATGPGEDPEFAEWVESLVRRHDLAMHIPACWALHAGLADELAALHDDEQDLLTSGKTIPLRWYDHLRTLVNGLSDRPAGRCARGMVHHDPPAWVAERESHDQSTWPSCALP
jgi:hypothetical protein